jgi:hypothetical protein
VAEGEKTVNEPVKPASWAIASADPAGPVRRGRPLAVAALLIVAVSVSAAFSFCFLGLGSEADNYRNVAVWQHIILTGEYLPSRTPGHTVSELLAGFLTSVLPVAGANLVVFAAAVASLALFYHLARPSIGDLGALLAVALIAANPNWIVAASSSDDTIYGVFFFVAGLAALRWRLPAVTACLFALATSSRAEYGPVSGVLLLALGGLHAAPGRRWLDGVVYAGLFGFVCLLLWLPVLISHQMTLAFLEPLVKVESGAAEQAVRWLYKTAMFFGLPAALLLTLAVSAGVWSGWRRDWPGAVATAAAGSAVNDPGAPAGRPLGHETRLAAGLCIYFLAFFAWYPVVPNPLLPVLYALAWLLLALPVSRWLIIAAALAQILTWFATPSLLRIDYASSGLGRKTVPVAARLDPHLAPGVLLEAARMRPQLDSFYFARMPAPGQPQDIYDHAARTTSRGSIRGIDDRVKFYLDD